MYQSCAENKLSERGEEREREKKIMCFYFENLIYKCFFFNESNL